MDTFACVLSDDDTCEDDAAFLSAIAEAEADGLRRLSQGDSTRKHERQHIQHTEPAESVSSSLRSSYSADYGDGGDGGYGYSDKEAASKRSRTEPEGEYLAALRGTHSETWQAMTSKARPDAKPRYAATSSFSGSANLGFEGGSGQGGLGGCFHCGKEGHWARDCPSKSMNPTPWGPDTTNILGQAQVPEKSCPCGGGACKVLTANTEKNAGRQFYRCPLRKEEGQCGFFEWCDNSTGINQGLSKERASSHVQIEFPCPCGAGACVTLTAKTEKNMGRQFYRCPLNQGEGSCGFFKWCDESFPASGVSAPAYGGSPFKEKMSMSTSNVGTGQCYKCGMDGHWAKDCSSAFSNATPKGFATTMRTGQGGSGTTMGTCYKCNQNGHWAKDCPSQQSSHSSKGAVGGFNRYGGETNFSRGVPNASSAYGSPETGREVGAVGNAGSAGCFKCGSQGHWSKDCPNASNARLSSYGGQSQGAYGGAGRSGGGSCYKCGGQGHWANECRAEGKGRNIY